MLMLNIQREKEEALKKILELERDIDAKQKLEMEIAELKGKLEVMKHLGGNDDAAVQKKIKEMNEELKDKMEEMDGMESLNQTLLLKERQSNDELQDARRTLKEVRYLISITLCSQNLVGSMQPSDGVVVSCCNIVLLIMLSYLH